MRLTISYHVLETLTPGVIIVLVPCSAGTRRMRCRSGVPSSVRSVTECHPDSVSEAQTSASRSRYLSLPLTPCSAAAMQAMKMFTSGQSGAASGEGGNMQSKVGRGADEISSRSYLDNVAMC